METSTPAASPAEWDVFVSYSRFDVQKIDVLVPALQALGLRVFVDDTAVDDFSSITATITEALSRSKVLLALYSADYPKRRACQWELTYAYLSGQHEGDPRRRTLVINPEHSADHVHPMELRDARHWPWPTVQKAVGRLAERVAAHVNAITTPMGDLAHAPFVPWLPAPARTGSMHFTGRLAEQWRIHTALHRHRSPLVAQAGAGRTAQLRGMPGIGKTLLAQEYALHFSSAFPGGIFWFDLHRLAGSRPSDVMAAYTEQVHTVLSALGLDPPATSLPGLLSHLAVALGERGTHCLWVVDGVPDGLSADDLHLLRGPHLLSATLITSRSLRYSSFAEAIDVPPLNDADGYRLLTSLRAPQGDPERAAARSLVRDVDGHPQALDLLAGLTEHGDFIRLRNRFHAPESDVLTNRRPLSRERGTDTSPAPPSPPPATDFLSSPLSGNLSSDDLLRLFATASPEPLAQTTLEDVLSTVGPYDPWEIPSVVAEAVDTLLGHGALRPDRTRERSWTIHPLLARAVRRHDTDTARQEDLRRILLHTLAGVLPVHPPAPAHTAVAPRPSARATPQTAEPAAPEAPGLPGTVERIAAFDLQIELVTRVGVQPLTGDQGSLREALTSLYSLFATTREVLHRLARETTGPLALPGIAANLANQHLRPFLSAWHPALEEYEATRPAGASQVEHERQWKRSTDIRAELAQLQGPLTSVAKELAALCGTDLLGGGRTNGG
ncbi:TIR domain-containing protein [Streptomyces sp. NPDC050428]|uniref:TIR domain-containing protein n=1 Tax=Streptomyces sp. NPDC050428 TaxID=3155757 RepID=UPI003420218B